MSERPTLETERLILRPHSLWDADELQKLIDDKDIASTTLNIPHPYTLEDAIDWLGQREEKFETTSSPQFAITHKDGYIIGGIGLNVNKEHENAELGYWIGKKFWGEGYCTEAARAVLIYGFEVMRLNRIHAKHFTRNPTSGRVMQKIGMKHEGCLRQEVKKWDNFEDLEVYGILKSDFFKSQR